jgi:hypothetical protein
MNIHLDHRHHQVSLDIHLDHRHHQVSLDFHLEPTHHKLRLNRASDKLENQAENLNSLGSVT